MALGVVACLWASPVSARPEFPGQLAEDPDVPCAPVCTVCHLVNPGTKGTAKRDFAYTMMGAGLMDQGAKKAFAALKMSDVASTKEMVARLEAGYDPNVSPSSKLLACGPQYGCGARVAKAPPRDGAGIVLAMVALCGYVVARRFKHRSAAPR